MKLMLDRIPDRIRLLGRMVFNDGCLSAEEVIAKFEGYFKLLGLPTRLADAGLTKEDQHLIVQIMNKVGSTGRVFQLDDSQRAAIVDFMAKG